MPVFKALRNSPDYAPEHLDASKHSQEYVNDLAQDGSVDMQGRRASRSRTGGWKACVFIIVFELSERLAYYGIEANLNKYLTTELHEGIAPSARNLNNWVGVTYIVPLVGAFVADVFWGRYWTIATLSIVYVLGLVSLALSVSIRSLRPPRCANLNAACPKANSAQLGVFFFSLYLISIGTGGVKPCLEAFGADQFDEADPSERRKKSSFFNAWNFGITIGALAAFTGLIYVENISWGVGYGIAAGVMGLALCLFFAGTRRYRHKRPGESPLVRVLQVFVAAVRKWRVRVPKDGSCLLHEVSSDEESLRIGRRQLLHTSGFPFLDKAAVRDEAEPELMSPWRLCTVTQVEEVKLLLRIVPVWLCSFMFGVVAAQIATFFTKQGITMDRRLGASSFTIPAPSIRSIITLVTLVSLPLYDRLFVPAARSLTGHDRGITILQRIGSGLLVSVLCLAVAAATETKRLHVAAENGLLDSPQATVPLSIAWLLPQYVLIGVIDVLAGVGMQEFFYDQVPDALRSLGMALYLCAAGMGSFLSSALIGVVERVSSHGGRQAGWFAPDNLNRSHLDYFYWLLAVLSALNLLVFLLVASFYTYKKPQSLALADHPSSTGFHQLKLPHAAAAPAAQELRPPLTHKH